MTNDILRYSLQKLINILNSIIYQMMVSPFKEMVKFFISTMVCYYGEVPKVKSYWGIGPYMRKIMRFKPLLTAKIGSLTSELLTRNLCLSTGDVTDRSWLAMSHDLVVELGHVTRWNGKLEEDRGAFVSVQTINLLKC